MQIKELNAALAAAYKAFRKNPSAANFAALTKAMFDYQQEVKK